jgi:hypothetical protein
MRLPPAVMVHSLAQAREAVAPGRPVTLLSAPGAALFAGVGWWRALVHAATRHTAATPDILADILDCADAPGRALEALRHGQRLLVLHASACQADIAERAASQGGVVLQVAPACLDLSIRGAERHLHDWLSGARTDN